MTVELKPINTKEKLNEVNQVAQADGHMTVYPTHYIEKNNEVIGSASVHGPFVVLWMHTRRATVVDSVKVIGDIEKLLVSRGHEFAIVPITTNSPFYPFMERLGLKKLCNMSLFLKPLGVK